jgi:uncharacterized protein
MDCSALRNRHGQRLDAAFHPARREDVLVVLGHGVTANKDRPLLVGLAGELAARGLPVLRFSFSGNGASDGHFAEATITRECEDLEDLLGQLPPGPVVYVGHSMGAAVGVRVAARHPGKIDVLVSLAGMVETAAFCDREFGDVTPGEGCMWDEPACPLSQAFVDDARAIGSTLDDARHLSQPWLLLHGTEDDVVPVSDSRLAREAAATRRRLLEFPGEGHMFSPAAHPRLAQAIEAWLREVDGG